MEHNQLLHVFVFFKKRVNVGETGKGVKLTPEGDSHWGRCKVASPDREVKKQKWKPNSVELWKEVMATEEKEIVT